jgi:Leucine-rich repeat (LRR) protein
MEETFLRSSSLAHFTIGLLSLNLFMGWAVTAHSGLGGLGMGARSESSSVSPDVNRIFPNVVLQQDGVFDNFEQALRTPEKVKRLVFQTENPEMKHLPPGLGKFVNLEALELSCLEKLEDLPEEIGQLRKLQELIIDNGNGCQMNVSLPRSIGQLTNLRVLRLYGALDAREIGSEASARRVQSKRLPDTLANLQKLEELDLGRNGIRTVPAQVASLHGLKKLSLDYNEIHILPAFVGNLTNLQELSLNSNGGVVLPRSLASAKGLKVFMGNNRLTLRDQKVLRTRFPNAVFSFENEYDDNAANEEAPKSKPKARRGRRL